MADGHSSSAQARTAGAPHFVLGGLHATNSWASSMDGLFAQCQTESCDVLCTWGEKTSFSVYDADQVLGPHLPGATPALAASGGHATTTPGEDGVSPRDNGSDAGVSTSVGRLVAPEPALEPALEPAPEPAVHNSGSDRTVYTVHWMSAVPAWTRSTHGGYTMKRIGNVDVLDQDAQKRCPACLEKLLRGQVAWKLPCFHLLHDQCARSLFCPSHRTPACPICRFEPCGSAQIEPRA